ncbi:MAG: glycosyltransferase family 39 protein [Acidobacteria bacterium]|nr:glycosyltransferase family 39 protein [Acidobacteriota bacterium]
MSFRLYRIDAPYVDAHSWRQVTNADIARNWAEGPIQFAKPMVNWGGPDGRVGMEFPLLHLLTAWTWRITGVNSAAGRAVAVVFSVGTVWLLYLVGTRLFGRPAGLASAAVLALSPSNVYFGRTLLSDVPMLFFSVGAVLGYVIYVQTSSRLAALLGATSLALAGLVKIPAILVLGPVIWCGIITRRNRLLADPWFVAAPLAALGAVFLWYLHADLLYQETGLTQAIFRPSGTYPGDIAAWSGPFATVSHWTRADLLTMDTFWRLAKRFYSLHLTPPLFVAALAGALFVWRPLPWRTIVDVWALASASLVLVSLAGQVPHEFHQLPTLPPLALYAGLAMAPVFDATRWRRLGMMRTVAIPVCAAAAIGYFVFNFRNEYGIRTLYRADQLGPLMVTAGWAIDVVTPKDALLVTMDYRHGGTNSPMLLYFSHRKGWSFDAESLLPTVIDYLRRERGACYFATSDWKALSELRADVVEYLADKPEVELPYTYWQFRLWDLGCSDQK